MEVLVLREEGGIGIEGGIGESRGKLAEAVCCCRQLLGSSGQKQPALPQQPPTIPPISCQLADFLDDKNYCLFCISEVSV